MLTKPAAADDRQLERQMKYYQNLEAIYQQLNKWDDAIRVTAGCWSTASN